MNNERLRGRRSAVRMAGLLMLLVAMVVPIGLPAMAAPGYQVDIPVSTTIAGDEDEFFLLATSAVPAEYQGQSCTAVSTANNSSVHPGNDILVRSGGTEVRLPDVESAPGIVVVDGIGTLVLGPEIEVWLDMGPSEFFSEGALITIECEGDEPPGRIIVVKQVAGESDTSQTFQFAASYDADGFALAHGQQNDSGDLAPGTYSVSETVPDGWALVGATCSDQSPIGAIDLQSGETVTCTFVNLQDEVAASIVVGVGSSCVTGEAGPQAMLDVTVSVANGATVVVRDSEGAVVGEFTESTSVPVEPGASYDWEATPSDGFTFPPGSETSGSIVIAPCDEVLASIVVTVGASCVQTSSGAEASLNVTVSVAGGATVVVRDSNGSIVGTFTDDGSVAAQASSTYTWQATPSEGFEFPAGSASSGAVTTATCVDVLPLTGSGSTSWAIVAGGLMAMGSLLLRLGRKQGRHQAS